MMEVTAGKSALKEAAGFKVELDMHVCVYVSFMQVEAPSGGAAAGNKGCGREQKPSHHPLRRWLLLSLCQTHTLLTHLPVFLPL